MDDVLRFWFDEAQPPGAAFDLRARITRWFQGGPEMDAAVTQRFGATVEAALRGELDPWADTARGRLALVLVLDQLTRNVLRGDARTFSGDEVALRLAWDAFDRGLDRDLAWIERLFLSMPLMHAEQVDAHRRLESIVDGLAADVPPEYAPVVAMQREQNTKYTAVLERFGRFPHRNEVLGRASTAEEQAFLAGWTERAPPSGVKAL